MDGREFVNEANYGQIVFKMATAEEDGGFDDDLESCVNVALAKFFPEIEKTTKQQMEAWKGIFRGKDVFAILPTGAGGNH